MLTSFLPFCKAGVEGEPGMPLAAVGERALEVNKELKQVFSRGESRKGRTEA